MSRFRLMGSNTFENIWLVDRKEAIINQYLNNSENEYGLILYTHEHRGSI